MYRRYHTLTVHAQRVHSPVGADGRGTWLMLDRYCAKQRFSSIVAISLIKAGPCCEIVYDIMPHLIHAMHPDGLY